MIVVSIHYFVRMVCYAAQINWYSNYIAPSDENLSTMNSLCSLASTVEYFIIWLTGDIQDTSLSKGTLTSLITDLFYISNFHT